MLIKYRYWLGDKVVVVNTKAVSWVIRRFVVVGKIKSFCALNSEGALQRMKQKSSTDEQIYSPWFQRLKHLGDRTVFDRSKIVLLARW